MKKLLLVLLVVTLASFLFVGCLPVTPAEGEGETEVGVTVEIDGAVVVDGKTYVSEGAHTITVTFPAPVVGGVAATITGCTGDYRPPISDIEVVLFPNADRTVWTGSGDFGYGTSAGCCASYVVVEAGECEAEACIWFPVIVDACYPFAQIEITAEACECEGCEIVFETVTDPEECADDILCCDDTCSGLASWSVVLYDDYPFDECCDPSVCEEPIGSCSGTECPILCSTECLPADTYYAVVTLVDNVANETVYYAEIILGADCVISVRYGWPDKGMGWDDDECVDWAEVTGDTIGECSETCD